MKITFEELDRFLQDQFPQGAAYGSLRKLGDGWAEMSLDVDDGHLRPGGTVSGPVMMGLADVTLYAALLSRIGLVPLAVTTNLNINFLRKPPPIRQSGRERLCSKWVAPWAWGRYLSTPKA